tara:strand:+ start:78 stop:497 length:420 start_codon:yes stop_codon:yes gene_type:complete
MDKNERKEKVELIEEALALELENQKLKEIIKEYREEKYLKYHMDDLIDSACEELEDIIKSEELDINCDDIDDTIHEIADSNIPIYYYEIARYCAVNTHLLTNKSEFAEDTEPYKHIQCNIYEELLDGLHTHLSKLQEEA